VTLRAADEHDTPDGPANRPDRIFLHGAISEEQRDMRREVPPPKKTYSPFRHGGSERPPEGFQFAQSSGTRQHKRPAPRPTTKAHRPIERHVEWLGLRLGDGFAGLLNQALRQTAEREQCHVQTIVRSQLAPELVGTLEYRCHPMNFRRGIHIRKDREKQPAGLTCTGIHLEIEQIMNMEICKGSTRCKYLFGEDSRRARDRLTSATRAEPSTGASGYSARAAPLAASSRAPARRGHSSACRRRRGRAPRRSR